MSIYDKVRIELFCRNCSQTWGIVNNLPMATMYAEAHDFLRSHPKDKKCNIVHIRIRPYKIK